MLPDVNFGWYMDTLWPDNMMSPKTEVLDLTFFFKFLNLYFHGIYGSH